MLEFIAPHGGPFKPSSMMEQPRTLNTAQMRISPAKIGDLNMRHGGFQGFPEIAVLS